MATLDSQSKFTLPHPSNLDSEPNFTGSHMVFLDSESNFDGKRRVILDSESNFSTLHLSELDSESNFAGSHMVFLDSESKIGPLTPRVWTASPDRLDSPQSFQPFEKPTSRAEWDAVSTGTETPGPSAR